MKKKLFAAALAAVLAVSAAGCSGSGQSASTKAGDGSQNSQAGWPKNVEIVVPASAGGDTDFNARLFAQKLSEKLPANFVVSNVTGNGGATGTRQVKDAANDGSKVLFYHSAFVVC